MSNSHQESASFDLPPPQAPEVINRPLPNLPSIQAPLYSTISDSYEEKNISIEILPSQQSLGEVQNIHPLPPAQNDRPLPPLPDNPPLVNVVQDINRKMFPFETEFTHGDKKSQFTSCIYGISQVSLSLIIFLAAEAIVFSKSLDYANDQLGPFKAKMNNPLIPWSIVAVVAAIGVAFGAW
ncbi:14361_t:CDS:2 [Acaulospora morrowiae]|uniref:14361_t:CDS:1 n=1 Tax=Acaulospora morrowiae TaxID=94023 RepID=A0A9N8W1G4_9GLOM|nr:14361_t:CDS:2 [Acaulospora morrowiae]